MSWYTSGQNDQNIRYWLLDSAHGSYETRRAAIQALSPNYAIANGRVANTKVVTGYATDAEITSNTLDIGGAVLDRVHNYINPNADVVSIRTNDWGDKYPLWGAFLQQPEALPTTGIDRLVAWWKNTGSDSVLYVSRDGAGTQSGASYANAIALTSILGTGAATDSTAYTILVLCGTLWKYSNDGAGTFVQQGGVHFKDGSAGTRTQILSHPVDTAKFMCGHRLGDGSYSSGSWTDEGGGMWSINIGTTLTVGTTGFVLCDSTGTPRGITKVASSAACAALADSWFEEENFSGSSDRIYVHLASGLSPQTTCYFGNLNGNMTLAIPNKTYFDVFGVSFYGAAWLGTGAVNSTQHRWFGCNFIFSAGRNPIFGNQVEVMNEATGAFTYEQPNGRTWLGCTFQYGYVAIYDTNGGHEKVPLNTTIQDCYFADFNLKPADGFGIDLYSAPDLHAIASQGCNGHTITNCRITRCGGQSITHYLQPNNFTTPTGGLELTDLYVLGFNYPTSCYTADSGVTYTTVAMCKNVTISHNLIESPRLTGDYAGSDGQPIALNGDTNQCLGLNGNYNDIVIEYNRIEGAYNDGCLRTTYSFPDGNTNYPIIRNNVVRCDGGIAFKAINQVDVGGGTVYETSFTFTDNDLQSTHRFVQIPNIDDTDHHIMILDRNFYRGAAVWETSGGSTVSTIEAWRALQPTGDTCDPNSTAGSLTTDTGSLTATAAQVAADVSVSLGADPDGSVTDLDYQWFVNDELIEGEESTTFDVSAYNDGDEVECVVIGQDAKGKWFLVTSNTVTLTSDADVDDGDATVTVVGSPVRGVTLTAVFADNDPDGAATGIGYQWQTTGAVDIAAATSSTLVLGLAQVGLTVRVKVTYTDGEGFSETIYSAYTATVTEPPTTPDTHDGGGKTKPGKGRGRSFRSAQTYLGEEIQPWNTQPLPSLEQLRKILGVVKRETPAEIEERAEKIEAVTEAVSGEAPAPADWKAPAEQPALGPSVETKKLLETLQRDISRARTALMDAQNEARRIAIARYERAAIELRTQIRDREQAEEDDELVQIIATVL